MEWISVKDRTPCLEDKTLIYVPGEEVNDVVFAQPVYCFDKYENTDWVWKGLDRVYMPSDVTHWMPLPKPPEVQDGD